MRENLVQEKHNGGLAGHFGIDKIVGQLRHYYFWPKMRAVVEKYVKRCRICQHAKGRSQNTGFEGIGMIIYVSNYNPMKKI